VSPHPDFVVTDKVTKGARLSTEGCIPLAKPKGARLEKEAKLIFLTRKVSSEKSFLNY